MLVLQPVVLLQPKLRLALLVLLPQLLLPVVLVLVLGPVQEAVGVLQPKLLLPVVLVLLGPVQEAVGVLLGRAWCPACSSMTTRSLRSALLRSTRACRSCVSPRHQQTAHSR